MTAVFITATGTDIGKTFLTAGLIRHIRGAGGAVAAIKPIVSGFDPGAWQNSDPAVLLAALGRPVILEEVERISPWRFKAPLSPHMAGKREGRAIVFQDLVEFCRRSMAGDRGVLLLEGVGGRLVTAAVDRAAREGLTIVPFCPFARGWLQRHPEVAGRVTIDWRAI